MSVSLLAGNVLRTPVVYGAELRNQRGLLPASVLRSPFVPGALLLTAADSETITAALYNLADLDTKIADLEFMNSPTWQELRNEPGGGSLSIDMEDPVLALFANDGTDIIYFYYRGVQAFELIPNRIREIFIATAEEPEEVTIYTGLGPLGVLSKAIVFPTNGPGRSPIEEDRHLGFTSREFDHSGWDAATVIGTVQHGIEVAAFILSIDPATIQDRLQQSLPITDVPLLWAPGANDYQDQPIGSCYFYEDDTMNAGLNVAADGDYVFYGIGGDQGYWSIDGQQVCSITGLNYMGVTNAAVTLTAGPHTVSGVMETLPFGPDDGSGSNFGSFGWLITTESPVNMFLDPDESVVQIIAKSSGNAKVLAYPPTVPGQTITKSFRLLLEEAQARGKLPNVVCGFTDTNYTDGRIAQPIPDFGTKVSTNLLNVAREITTYVDVRAKVSTVAGVRKIVISMWEAGTAGGVATGVAFERAAPGGDTSTGNLNQYERETELVLIDDALVRWDGGWTLLDATDGPYSAEAPLEIGAPSSIEEVLRMTLAALAEVNTPRGEITAGLEPRDASEAPYTGFQLFDTILSTPTGPEQVAGWTFSEDRQTGNTVIKVTLGDPLLSTQARQSIELQKAL